ncbi:T9SS type A sorting domain-containing protein [Hymenobacter gummosus]|uniref:T9SS type A sorting domain-containing protein n=1 Tax=Hymenobacter gummosus TaxID=1776032 RepID=A0A3S0K947_9BACT|nr:T9SS type A sorting domain-containing protein [Hymenobacter gummosus]RTQ53658.1 T9SS type A sorting domain-containing protein [Hymenobacter gummosus]
MKLPLLIGCLVGVTVLAMSPKAATAQTADSSFRVPSIFQVSDIGDVAQQSDGKRIIVGGFDYVNGHLARGIARLNVDGSLDQAFQANARVTKSSSSILRRPAQVRVMPNGKILLATFGNSQDTLVVSGLKRVELLMLNPDGTPDPGFNAGAGSHNDNYLTNLLVQPDGKILVAGPIASFNTSPRFRRIVRLLANGAVDPAFDAALDPMREITAVALQPDGKVVISADFYRYNSSQTDSRVVRLLPNGTVDTSFQAYTTTTRVSKLLVQPDGRVLVAGTGGAAAGSTGPYSNSIERLLPNGQPDASFALAALLANPRPLINGYLTDVALQPDGKILAGMSIGGSFQLVRVNADGSADNTWQPGRGPNWGPAAVRVMPDGRILIGGHLTRCGDEAGALFLLSATGTIDPSFRPSVQVPGLVSALAQQPDGKLLVGGTFHEIGTTVADNLARLNADGSVDASFTAQSRTDGAVYSLGLQPDGKVLVGGYFTTVGTSPRTGLARVLAAGGPDASFDANAQFAGQVIVRSVLLLADGSAWVGGHFQTVNGQYSLAKVGADGSADTRATVPTVSGIVNALLLQADGRILVGGQFGRLGSVNTLNLGRLSAAGVPEAGFVMTGFNDPFFEVKSLLQQPDGKLLVGGWLSFADKVRRLELNGSADAGFVANTPVYGAEAMALQANGGILVGGSYVASHTPREVVWGGLGLLTPSGSVDPGFSLLRGPISDPAQNQRVTVQALLTQPDGKVLVGGNFVQAGGEPHLSLVRLLAPGVLATAGPKATARLQVYPNPAHGTLHLSLAATAQPQLVHLLNLTGQRVLTQSVTGPVMDLDVRQLPAGVYLLRVDYADGPVTRRVVVE